MFHYLAVDTVSCTVVEPVNLDWPAADEALADSVVDTGANSRVGFTREGALEGVEARTRDSSALAAAISMRSLSDELFRAQVYGPADVYSAIADAVAYVRELLDVESPRDNNDDREYGARDGMGADDVWRVPGMEPAAAGGSDLQPARSLWAEARTVRPFAKRQSQPPFFRVPSPTPVWHSA